MPLEVARSEHLSGSDDPEVPGQADVSNQDGLHRRHGRLWPGVVCCVLYVVFASATYGFAPLGSSRVPGIKWNDSVEEIWWLAWAAHAFPNVHSLFLAQGQNYPYGQNFGVNGSMLALGVLFAPITHAFGPIVTFELLLRLGLATSAASMCFVLRRWTSWWPAAFVGGLLYGFSAYTYTFGSDLFLIFVPLPPLIMLVLYEIFVRQKWRVEIAGIALGLLCVLQFFIWVEVLAGSVVIGSLGITLLLIVSRDKFAERWRYAARAAIYAFGVATVLLAYPLVFTFTGPESVKGSPQLTFFLATFNTDLLDPLKAVSRQWLVPDLLTAASSDNALYLGLPLILVLACFAVFLRSRKEILFAGAMTLIAFVLSLGSHLTINGHRTWVSLPYSVLSHLPALSGFEARRFALFTDLFAAAMFAIGMDELRKRLRQYPHTRNPAKPNRALRIVAPGFLALAVVLPLVPRSIQPTTQTPVPDFFTSRAVDSIPSGGVVLAFPYPDGATNAPLALLTRPVDSAMLDQAVSGMRFTLIGGFGWFPSPSGEGGVSSTPQLEPRSVQALFDSGYLGGTPPKGNMDANLRTFLYKYDVQAVLVAPPGRPDVDPNLGRVVSALTEAIGPPKSTGGVTAWFNVGHRLAATAPSVRDPVRAHVPG